MKDLLDKIEVKSPCSESWDEMSGNEKVRFCSHCAKSVNNISEMTRKEAFKLVRKSEGNLCIRYYQKPSGKKLFLPQLHQIIRRTGVLAGTLSAALSVSSVAYAQTTTEETPQNQPEIIQTVKSGDKTGSISGYVKDQDGAILPYALVTILNEQTNEYRTANANNEGFYEFKELADGSYKLKIDANGFSSKELTIAVSNSIDTQQDFQLSVRQVNEVVQVGGEGNGEAYGVGSGFGGAMVSISYENPLINAAYDENIDEIKSLLSKGIRINVKEKRSGETALHAAIGTGNVEITEYLLTHGAKANIRDAKKRTPLMMLDEDATPELINLLLRFGAKTTPIDKDKNTVLHHFAEYGKSEIMQIMIVHGANVNAVNKRKQTALMIAAENENFEAVKTLLGSGADVNLKNSDDETVYDLASNGEIKDLLISYGAGEK
jgi:Ankyrin repeats (3 copies)/Carboxypeptidase regulatory-like domain/Ankyrin repeats (many copies)